nr:reverse transcriptase domain-containing protein [Tanacetum cinerariifolium]
MSSPCHPTSNIEDAFSLNFPDYLPASPDYVPASPRKTYSSSSNSFGVVPISSPTLLFFHDDPYMKVLQAFYTVKSPIPPLIIIPPSSMHNPQEFFLLKEFLSPKKQGHDQSSSSTSTLPQAFEIGESSRKASLEQHEEKIKGILNHLDVLSSNRIEHIKGNIEGLGKECLIKGIQHLQHRHLQHQPWTRLPSEKAYKLSWVEFKKLLIKKYCPRTKVQKREDEFYNLTVKGNDLKTYVRRFQELTTLCPTMVSDSEKMMEAFIGRLPQSIEGNITASKPQTLEEATNISRG